MSSCVRNISHIIRIGYDDRGMGVFPWAGMGQFFLKERLMRIVNRTMLSGHPWRIEHCIFIGLERNPFICTWDVALLYSLCTLFLNVVLNPQASMTARRYVCATLSKACFKSSVNIHAVAFVCSECAIVSLIETMAPNMLL
jgi:hypothetical protein